MNKPFTAWAENSKTEFHWWGSKSLQTSSQTFRVLVSRPKKYYWSIEYNNDQQVLKFLDDNKKPA